ncbi:MAG TPA: TonB-dependent receptor [Rhizomicrobium sp.]|jgi:iron complex outermembrane receptor protein
MRIHSVARRLATASAIFVSICSTDPASAQTAPPENPAAKSTGIELVTVTATRRSELLNKVPQSISAFTADKIDQINAKSIADLVRYTPGVTFDPVTKNVSIRGVNSTAGDATTGIYIDDTPIQLRELGFGSDNTLPAIFDLERVEVLRGPQGTLFGAGSEGGTVRYITPTPSLTDFSVYGKTELSVTENGAPNYEGGVAIGGPIIDNTLGFRISAWGRRDGGWIDKVDYMTGATLQSDSNYVNTYVVRGALLWQATPSLAITPSVFYQNRRQNNIDQFWVALSNPDHGVYKTATPENMADKDRFFLPAVKAEWNLGDVEFISNTSYFDRRELVQDYSGTLYNLSYFQQSVDFGLNPDFVTPCIGGLCGAIAAQIAIDPNFVGAPLLTAGGIDLPGFGHYVSVNNVTNTQQNFTQEVRLQSSDPDARLSWIVGVFYTLQSQLSIEEINDPQLPELTEFLWGDTIENIWGEGLLPNGDDYINHTQSHSRQIALFANATYAVTEALKVQVGARVARTHFDFNNFSDGAQNFGPLSVPGDKKDETPFTPMASVNYQITPDDMVYATVVKGYRIGGANPLFPVGACTEIDVEPTSYNSDSVISYEAGTKDRFLDGQLLASGSIFYLKWSNIQQINYLPSCGFKYTTNQGSAESRGFDLQGEWLVTDGLDLDFSLGYTDAYYTRTAVAAGLLLARKGDKLPGSPWTFSLGGQYTTDIMDYPSFIRLDYEYSSRETGLTPSRDPFVDPVFGNVSSFDPALVPEPATSVLSLRVGATFDNFQVTLFAENLLDSHPQLDLNHQDSSTLLFEASTLRPRTVGFTLTYRD